MEINTKDNVIREIIPTYDAPNIDVFRETRDYFSTCTENLSTHKVKPETLDMFKDGVLEKFDFTVKAWNGRPRYFESKDSADWYLSHIKSTLTEIKIFVDGADKKCAELQKKVFIDWKTTKFEEITPWIVAIVFSILAYIGMSKDNTDYAFLKTVGVFFGSIIGTALVFAMIDIPFEIWRRIKYKNSTIPVHKWITDFKNDVDIFIGRIHGAEHDIFSDIEENKRLMTRIKERQIDDHFEGKKSARFMAERLAMIEAEAKRAIETARSLEEQHRLTEEVRTKYAKEMIEYQKDVKNTNDQAFIDKLALVESLLSGDSK